MRSITAGAAPQPDRHGYIKARMRGLLVLASLGTIAVAATATVGLATTGAITPAIPKVLGITAAFGIDLAVFLASFRLLTAAPMTGRQVLPGAALAAVCRLLQQALGGVYVTQVLKGSSQTCGGFAAEVGMLAWLLIAAEITLMAAEVNVVLARDLWPRSLAGDLRPADERTMRDSGEAAQRDLREHITVTFERPHERDRLPSNASRAR